MIVVTLAVQKALRTRLLLPFPRSTRFLVNVRLGSGRAYGSHSYFFETYFSIRFCKSMGSTSSELSPDEGPRTALRSWTSLLNASTWFVALLVRSKAGILTEVGMVDGEGLGAM